MAFIVKSRHCIVRLRRELRPRDAPLGERFEDRKSPTAHEPVHQRGDEHGFTGPRQAGDAEPHSRIDQALAVFHHGTRGKAGLFDEFGEGEGHGFWNVESGIARGKASKILQMKAIIAIIEPMNSQDILNRLRENEPALRARGVTHAALFGSRARGDNRPDSDIDIMIEVAPEIVQDVYDYVRLKRFIAALFASQVDVVDRDALKPYVRPPAEGDAVYAF
jgi:uncharacterized protein